MKPLFCLCLIITLQFAALTPSSHTASSATAMVEVADICEPNPNPITWFPASVECPVCKTKNIFLKVGSWGNYIYQDPTKFQLVFWPFTDSPSWYSCKKCRYTAYMGDFEGLPADKLDDLRKMLATVSLPAQKSRSDKEEIGKQAYLELPVSARMLVAEQVQRTLGNTKPDFWNHFYRVLAYHFDVEDQPAKADEARRKALAVTLEMLADKKRDGERKELLYVAGAMNHFLRDDVAAKKLFTDASSLSYRNAELDDERNQGYNKYLSELIEQYLEMLDKGEGPAKMKAKAEH